MAKLEIIRKSGVPFSDIINGVEGYARYVQGTDAQFIKHPTTWLNGECWSNEYPAAPRSNESAFVTGVANVAARYGVTAGMGATSTNTNAVGIIDYGAPRSNWSAEQLRAFGYAIQPKRSYDGK